MKKNMIASAMPIVFSAQNNSNKHIEASIFGENNNATITVSGNPHVSLSVADVKQWASARVIEIDLLKVSSKNILFSKKKKQFLSLSFLKGGMFGKFEGCSYYFNDIAKDGDRYFSECALPKDKLLVIDDIWNIHFKLLPKQQMSIYLYPVKIISLSNKKDDGYINVQQFLR